MCYFITGKNENHLKCFFRKVSGCVSWATPFDSVPESPSPVGCPLPSWKLAGSYGSRPQLWEALRSFWDSSTFVTSPAFTFVSLICCSVMISIKALKNKKGKACMSLGQNRRKDWSRGPQPVQGQMSKAHLGRWVVMGLKKTDGQASPPHQISSPLFF